MKTPIKNRKIAIISELVNDNVNYGNRLQAYALNQFLLINFKFLTVDSLILDGFKYRNYFHYTRLGHAFASKVLDKLTSKKNCGEKDENAQVVNAIVERKNKFSNFLRSHPEFSTRVINYDELINSDYDTFIVGSDVVWAQVPNKVSRIKFLDFSTKKAFDRIAYAPSMLKEYFPKENQKYVRHCLEKFNAISVRERFSVLLLDKIGIEAKLVCDPTILLSKEEWKKIADAPNIKEKYIFVYLLGKNKACRKKIMKLAKDLGLKVITIPYADGTYDGEEDFGDYRLSDCGPEEWVGLIQNAEYIFTDSFHGLMFATIFEKRFLIIKKEEAGKSAEEHPPARMIDFLETINETNKYIPVPSVEQLEEMTWNYKKINKNIGEFRKASIEYLRNNLL